MEKDLHSDIKYDKLIVTSALVEHLGFKDVTITIRGFSGGAEKVYLHEETRIIVYFEPIEKAQHTNIKRKYPVYTCVHLDASLLTLKVLVETMMEEVSASARGEGHTAGYEVGYEYAMNSCRERLLND